MNVLIGVSALFMVIYQPKLFHHPLIYYFSTFLKCGMNKKTRLKNPIS